MGNELSGGSSAEKPTWFWEERVWFGQAMTWSW
jgi:hypothetical protein